MKIGVLADTHDRLPAIKKALAGFGHHNVETVIHAGDVVAPFAAKRLLSCPGRLYVIYGNNDGEREGLKSVLPQIQDGPLTLELGGKRILIHHFADWCTPDHIAQADIIITGHDHEVANQRRDGKLYLNPGECCGWLYGRCTAAVLDTELMSAEIIEVAP
ncbi:MAG: metallophosphoesterase [Planctomycetota bacterium]|nr:MAG: metallophosphoesterase [Planctomycetota bacterium]